MSNFCLTWVHLGFNLGLLREPFEPQTWSKINPTINQMSRWVDIPPRHRLKITHDRPQRPQELPERLHDRPKRLPRALPEAVSLRDPRPLRAAPRMPPIGLISLPNNVFFKNSQHSSSYHKVMYWTCQEAIKMIQELSKSKINILEPPSACRQAPRRDSRSTNN